MRCFDNIAKLIRERRMAHPKGFSQSELSHLLGYKNGQFISNVERALCNVPLKMLLKVSDVLDISPDELKDAILKDQEMTLENYLAGSQIYGRKVKKDKDHVIMKHERILSTNDSHDTHRENNINRDRND